MDANSDATAKIYRVSFVYCGITHVASVMAYTPDEAISIAKSAYPSGESFEVES